jgi:hypothetical protein
VATRLLTELSPILSTSTSPRAVAYGLIGLGLPDPDHLPEAANALIEPLAARLLAWYDDTSRPDWPWFEKYLTYDNARLPQALLLAGRRTNQPRFTEVGLRSLDWFADQCDLESQAVRLVGNRWRSVAFEIGSIEDEGDEQPLDAAALTEALITAYEVTGDPRHAERAQSAFGWFIGRNRLALMVYDEQTGGCHDGLGIQTMNHNQGAESTLAFFQGYLAARRALPDRDS